MHDQGVATRNQRVTTHHPMVATLPRSAGRLTAMDERGSGTRRHFVRYFDQPK